MRTESTIAQPDDGEEERAEFSAEDLAKIFHYPSIGQLFSDPTPASIDGFTSRMVSTRDQLEKIVRHGSREDADKAGTVVKSINVTLDFLQTLQSMRVGDK